MFIDGFNIISGKIDNDYLETTTTDVVLETVGGNSGIQAGDWAVLVDDNRKIIYAGFVKSDPVSTNLTTTLTIASWQGALIGELEQFNQFSLNYELSNTNNWEDFANKYINSNFGSRDESQIDFLKVDDYYYTTTMMTVQSDETQPNYMMALDRYDQTKPAVIDPADENADPFENRVAFSRLDAVTRAFNSGNVTVIPSELRQNADGTWNLIMIAVNNYTLSSAPSTDLYGRKIAKIVVNASDDSIRNLKIENRRFEVMEANALYLIVANWSGTAWNSWTGYWYWRKSDGTVTTDKTDPLIMLPSKTIVKHEKSTDGYNNAQTRLSYAQNELVQKSGEFDISFDMLLKDNFLVNNYEVKGDGTDANPYVYVSHPTAFSNINIGANWNIYSNGIKYDVQLTGFMLSIENGTQILSPKFGASRSTIKYLTNKLRTGFK